MKATVKALAVAATIAAIAAVVWGIAGAEIGHALFERAAARALTRESIAELPEGLHVALCGSGSPMADPRRAGPCVAVVAGERLFVVDTGSGSSRNLTLMGLAPGRIEAILLTHFHSDHIDGLGELMLQRWAGGTHGQPVPVIGPVGVDEVVAGFNRAYAQDFTYRIAHHGPKVVPPEGAGGRGVPFSFTPGDSAPSLVVVDEDGLTITAFGVDHRPVAPAVGYRFDYRGRSAVVSGDTAATPSVAAIAAGVDLLVHEALQDTLVATLHEQAEAVGNHVAAHITEDIPSYHATPEQAARAARRSGVGHLLLYHLVPPLPTKLLYRAFLGEARSIFDGPVTVGEDGMIVSLPADSDEIVLDRLM